MGNNAARLMYHLSGDVELRSPEHGFSGVAVCRSVPEEVSAQAKDEMAKKIAQKDSKKLKTGAAEENRSADGDLRAAFQIASNAKGVSGKDAAKVKADNSVSDYFDSTATAYNQANSVFFKEMIQSVQRAGAPNKPYVPPCANTLGGSILDRQYESDMRENKRLLALPAVSRWWGLTKSDRGGRGGGLISLNLREFMCKPP